MSLALLGAVSQGILWGVMVLGVFITYKLLDIADLTVDGSFALGGCVCAVCIVGGMDPLAAIVFATLAGLVAGAVTGLLHTLFEIPAILAGILTQIGLWSVNLRIMGKSNTPLMQSETIFSRVSELTGLSQSMATAVVGIVVAVVIILALYWFFGTEIGSALRATGNNEDMVRALGINPKVTKVIALMISNGLVGLSGGLIGTGAIVIGLAAIVIGEVLWRVLPGSKLHAFGGRLSSAVVGSVVYFLIRAIVLQLGLDANDMKLFSAILVALALCVPVVWEKYRLKRSYSKYEKGGDAAC